MQRPFAKTHKLSLVTLAIFASTSALAEDPLGWYVGGNVGPATHSFDSPATVAPLLPLGFVVTGTSGRDRDKYGYKLYGGYQINRNFAVEGGLFNLGDSRHSYNTAPPGTLNIISHVRGLNLDLVGIMPISDRFSAFGRVGVAHTRNRSNFTNTGAVPANGTERSANDLGIKFGAGLQYSFTDRLSVRGEIERYRVKDAIRPSGHVDMVSLGLVYRFGEKARSPVVQTVAPVYVAPPPPPPPPRPMAPPPPPPPPVFVPPPPPPPAVYVPPERPARQGRN